MKEILRTILEEQRVWPIEGVLVSAVMELTTPAGSEVRERRERSELAVKGVSKAGFRIEVQPAARAGASFRAIIAAGKFHLDNGLSNAIEERMCWCWKHHD